MKITPSNESRHVKLARNWSKSRVCGCLEGGQKHELIRFLRERYSERFLSPIRCLRNAPGNNQGYGFAIMALCCLLVEAIECYEQGVPSSGEPDKKGKATGVWKLNETAPQVYKLPAKWPMKSSREAFQKFFNDNTHRRYFPGVDGSVFYYKIRCGLLHQAQTEDGWLIGRTGPFWDAPRKRINREEFAARLEESFEDFLSRLDRSRWDGSDKTKAWLNARRKIWWLAALSG